MKMARTYDKRAILCESIPFTVSGYSYHGIPFKSFLMCE